MAESFKAQQLKFSRVRNAFKLKETEVQRRFAAAGLTYPPQEIFIRAFKTEQVLEVWVKQGEEFKLFHEYSVCAASGDLGPKRRQGDYQVPEGFYFIDRFNPTSSFHLSLGLNYPNASDRILGQKGNLGGDIFIHGNCVSIGCLAIQDEQIREVYLLAVEAKQQGQRQIPVHIFPFKLSADTLKTQLARYPEHQQLWEDLKAGYEYFEQNKTLPIFESRSDGRYRLKGR